MLFCNRRPLADRQLSAAPIALALLISSALAAPVMAQPAAPPNTVPAERHPKFDATRFVPESELKNGQLGYALTVFRGTRIDRFGIKILGVLKKVNNGKDLILIKVTSGPSVSRKANIAHGMSGSPVYLGKRMVGAIAYSLPFAKEPIGLVTPIGDMLDAWDPDLPSKPNIAMETGSFGSAASAGLAVSNSLLAGYIAPSDLRSGLGRAEDATKFEALGTPLMISGMTPQAISRLSPSLAPLGLIPMAGGGSSVDRAATASEENSLVPGAAVGVSIVQGDIDMTAIGTLTYRDGNRVIAFGHPFTGIGPIDAAMTTATITDLFPSVQDSIKLGAPGATVGRIFQDRPFSVGGIIGSMPHMVPVSVSINDQSDKRVRVFHARVINHPLLTGSLVVSVVNEAILETHGSPGDAIAQVKMDVDTEQLGHVVRTNVFYDPLNMAQRAVTDLDSLMALFSANPFSPITIRSVKFEISIQSRHDTAQIDHIFVPKVRYQPGDKVDVGVVVKRYKQDPVVRNLTLTIPPSTPNGQVTLIVRGGTPTMMEMAGLRPSGSGAPPTNINQLVRKFLERPKNNEMVASLMLPTTAINVQGEKLSLLPPNFSSIMRGQHSTGLKLERDEVKLVQTMPWVLTGSQTLSITVARKNPLDTPETTPQAGGQSPPSQQEQQPVASVGPSETPEESGNDSDEAAKGWPLMTQNLAQTASAPAQAPQANASVAPSSLAPAKLDEEAKGPQEGASLQVAGVTIVGPPDKNGADGDDDKAVPVGRVADTWRQDNADEFASGTLQNVAITSSNELRLAASPEFFASTTASYIWSMVTSEKGDVYAGTGDDGVVYKSDEKGVLTPLFHTGELEITALAINRQTGEIFAGTAPHGIVFRITPDGKGAKVFTAEEKYVTALAADVAHGKLYIATGGGAGRVYAAPLNDVSAAKPFWTSQTAHILSIAVDSAGLVYASGAPDGVLYAITPLGKASVFFAAPTGSVVSAVTVGKGDQIYAGTAPRGMLLKLTPSPMGTAPVVKPLLTKAIAPIYGLQADSDGGIWAIAGSTLYSVSPDNTVLTHTAETDVQFTTVAVADNGSIYAGTSDIGQIYRLSDRDTAATPVNEGSYVSPVHDTKLSSRWGTITWDAITPPGTSVAIQTRTGDVPHPDESWSDWSSAYGTSDGAPITSPAARYIQYRAQFAGRAADPGARASLSAVTIYFLTRNQPPTVKLRDPIGGDAVNGEYNVRWNASDPDHDTLSYDLYYSTDQKDWTLIKPAVRDTLPKTPPMATAHMTDAQAGIKGGSVIKDPVTGKPVSPAPRPSAKIPPPPAPPGLSTPATMPGTNAADVHLVPVVVPRPNGPRPPATANGATARATNAPGSASPVHLTATSSKWDTAKLPDGRYWLKVIASDQPSNPVDALTAESISGPIIVDNAPPSVKFDGPPTVDDKKRATVKGVATGKLAYIAAVQYRIDDQTTWSAAAPASGLFDSTREAFTLTTPPLTPGIHRITVEAINEADNTGQLMIPADVPK
ncbi:MAG: SpoIVB peptidase S55 domain-containing protein [Capsulimonadaceae bacterium]|nr:SpoIVB peptidase S55 domain-containing protein [Capsulimonadaceae bacterium]